MTTTTVRLEQLQNCDEHIADLYGSMQLALLIKQTAEQFAIVDKDTYIDAIGDTILGLVQTKDLPHILQTQLNISADTAQRVVSTFAEIMTPVLEREKLLTNPKLAELKALHKEFTAAAGAKTITQTQPTLINNQAQKPSQPMTQKTESKPTDSPHNVSPMRTMAGDMNRIHGYGAYRQVNPQDQDPADDPARAAQSQADLLQQ